MLRVLALQATWSLLVCISRFTSLRFGKQHHISATTSHLFIHFDERITAQKLGKQEVEFRRNMVWR